MKLRTPNTCSQVQVDDSVLVFVLSTEKAYDESRILLSPEKPYYCMHSNSLICESLPRGQSNGLREQQAVLEEECQAAGIQPVYGAQHPPLDPRLTKNFIKEWSKVNTVPLKNKKASSFLQFAQNTSDVSDIGDDEEEDFSTPPFQTLNSKVALVTAAQVLENHSQLKVKPEWSQSRMSGVPANPRL
ncbi:TBC1 domain family member 22B [Tupaia chinensis]|uniref:TBC1 domain family member 22B n=1 Tax=Tupaia chinensis TaxID=246437 RepID=L9JM93_TUPCH|nr:TBC1 domain family member 22B [Tupaia chinensis]